MIKSIKVAHLKLNLRAIESLDTRSKLRHIGKVWEVLNEDKTIRKAIVYQVNAVALTRKLGWQQFKEKYCVIEIFWGHKLFIAPTRHAALGKMYELEHPNEPRVLLREAN